jgi:hypothetical protein
MQSVQKRRKPWLSGQRAKRRLHADPRQVGGPHTRPLFQRVERLLDLAERNKDSRCPDG